MIHTLYRPIRTARLTAAKTHRRRVARALAPALARYRNGTHITRALSTNTLTTITKHMATLGADTNTQHRFASHAGKHVKAAYKAHHGHDPLQIWTVRNGRLITVHAYTHHEPALTTGLSQYNRTAHLITTPTTHTTQP